MTILENGTIGEDMTKNLPGMTDSMLLINAGKAQDSTDS